MDISNISLTQLLPYDLIKKVKHAEVTKGVEEYRTILNVTVEACASYALSPRVCDSLVGENNCHTRTILTCLTHRKLHDMSNVEKRTNAVLKKMSLIQVKGSLDKIINQNDLNVTLDKDEMFLIQSYFLFLMKTTEASDSLFTIEKADHKKILEKGKVTASFAHKFQSHLRKSLATASVQFVKERAKQLEDRVLSDMTSDKFTYNYNDLPCLPMFWTCKTVFTVALREKIPLVFQAKFMKQEEKGYICIDKETVLFKATKESYVFSEVQEEDLSYAGCVVEGAVVQKEGVGFCNKKIWKEWMQTVSPIDVILAGAADHRQYPDAKGDEMIHDIKDEELERFRILADKNGFSVRNPTGFFIQHVYSELLGKIFS